MNEAAIDTTHGARRATIRSTVAGLSLRSGSICAHWKQQNLIAKRRAPGSLERETRT